MKIVFLGTSAFGLPTIEAIHQHPDHELIGVVTGPDKPQGRGRKPSPTPIGQWADRNRFTSLWKPTSLRDPELARELKALNADVFVVVAFRILPESLYTIPRYAFNLHASLLPAYRGAAPIQRAIMAGETHTGVTTFLLQRRVDTGAILAQRTTEIPPEATSGDLARRLSEIGAELVVETLDILRSGNVTPIQQDDSRASPAPKLTPADRILDFAQSAPAVINRVRGLAPKPAAIVLFRGRLVKVLALREVGVSSGGYQPGAVIMADPKEGVHIAIGQSCVAVEQLQPEGKRVQTGAEFVRGYRVTTDDRFERVPEERIG
ncbi:MAG: methionyl-tRNA formyltransferase [Candidatus Zixiibacteriota bacterium]